MTWRKKGSSTATVYKQPAGGSVYREFPVMQFAGLNNKYAPIHIADNEASDLMNVVFDEFGAITKRNGYFPISNAPVDEYPVNSLIPFYLSDGNVMLLAASGSSIYKWSGTASQYTAIWGEAVWGSSTWGLNFTAVKTGLGGYNARFTHATYYDKLYMMNGNINDGLMVWDGSVFSTVSGAPAGQYIAVHKNRLYIAGDSNNPSRLYMSDLGTPTSWPALNFIDINTNDGDKITGLIEYLDSLIIFKKRSIHILRGSGPQNYMVVDVNVNRGTVSHWSIVNANGHLFFLAEDGVYSFNGKSIQLMSDPISGSVLGINNQIGWNHQYLSLACGIDYNHKYWLSVPEGNTTFLNNRVYAYDYIHNIWTRFDLSCSCFAIFDSGKDKFLLSGDVADGFIYQQDIGSNDNGNAINAYLTTKAFDFGAQAHYKSYKGLFFYAAQELSQYSINITYNGDFGRFNKTVPLNLAAATASKWGTMAWGTSPWGAYGNVAARTTNIAGQSRYLQFTVQGNGKDQPFTFYGWVVLYNVKRRLR